jgi:hypothetical protein
VEKWLRMYLHYLQESVAHKQVDIEGQPEVEERMQKLGQGPGTLNWGAGRAGAAKKIEEDEALILRWRGQNQTTGGNTFRTEDPLRLWKRRDKRSPKACHEGKMATPWENELLQYWHRQPEDHGANKYGPRPDQGECAIVQLVQWLDPGPHWAGMCRGKGHALVPHLAIIRPCGATFVVANIS